MSAAGSMAPAFASAAHTAPSTTVLAIARSVTRCSNSASRISRSVGCLDNSNEDRAPAGTQALVGAHPQAIGATNEEYPALQALCAGPAERSLPLLPGAAVNRVCHGRPQNAAMPGRSNPSRKHRRGVLALQPGEGHDAVFQIPQTDIAFVPARRRDAVHIDLVVAAHLDTRASRLHQHSSVGGISARLTHSALDPATGADTAAAPGLTDPLVAAAVNYRRAA